MVLAGQCVDAVAVVAVAHKALFLVIVGGLLLGELGRRLFRSVALCFLPGLCGREAESTLVLVVEIEAPLRHKLLVLSVLLALFHS